MRGGRHNAVGGAGLFLLGFVLLATVIAAILIQSSGNAVMITGRANTYKASILADEFGWAPSEPRQRIGVFVTVGKPVIAGNWARPDMVFVGVIFQQPPMPCYAERVVSIWLSHQGLDGEWAAISPENQVQFLRTYGEILADKFVPNPPILPRHLRFINGSTDESQLLRRALASGEAEFTDRRVLWSNLPANLVAWLPESVRLPVAISLSVVGGVVWGFGKHRHAFGACVHCGYDLTGTPHSTRCPECGVSTREADGPMPTTSGN